LATIHEGNEEEAVEGEEGAEEQSVEVEATSQKAADEE
jgi:hypothetical protein